MLATCAVAGGVWLAAASSVMAADSGAYVLADVQCDGARQGVLDLTLVNDDPSATARVEVLGEPAITVGPLSAHAITMTDLDDGALTVPIQVDGADASVVVAVHCDAPAVDAPMVEVLPATVRRVPDGAARLPSTGGGTTWGLLVGGVLVAAGVAASLVARRQHP